MAFIRPQGVTLCDSRSCAESVPVELWSWASFLSRVRLPHPPRTMDSGQREVIRLVEQALMARMTEARWSAGSCILSILIGTPGTFVLSDPGCQDSPEPGRA